LAKQDPFSLQDLVTNQIAAAKVAEQCLRRGLKLKTISFEEQDRQTQEQIQVLEKSFSDLKKTCREKEQELHQVQVLC